MMRTLDDVVEWGLLHVNHYWIHAAADGKARTTIEVDPGELMNAIVIMQVHGMVPQHMIPRAQVPDDE